MATFGTGGTKIKVDATLRVTRPENAREFGFGFVAQGVMPVYVTRVFPCQQEGLTGACPEL